MPSQAIPYITPEEYLNAERAAEYKSEYCNGRVYAMAGGSLRHNLIATNTTSALVVALAGTSCQAFNSDTRVYIPKTSLFAYPDALAVCGPPEVFDGDNLLNPIVIVEAVPRSSRHDRTTKFLDYQSIPSLKEYLMISHRPHAATVCTRMSDEVWRIEDIGEERGSIRLTSIGVELTFGQIYAGADELPG